MNAVEIQAMTSELAIQPFDAAAHNALPAKIAPVKVGKKEKA
jgi:hypothetical protein